MWLEASSTESVLIVCLVALFCAVAGAISGVLAWWLRRRRSCTASEAYAEEPSVLLEPSPLPSSLAQQLALVDESSDDWLILRDLMHVANPKQLGTEVREVGKYKSLKLLHAWRHDDPHVHEVYKAKFRIVRRHIIELQDDSLTSAGVTTKLDAVCDRFGLNQSVNEKVLLFGTKAKHVCSILRSGLNTRLSSSRGPFSPGIYLAEDMAKADQYCTRAGPQDFADLHELLYKSKNLPQVPQHVLYCFVVFVVLGVPVFTKDGSTSMSDGGPLFASDDQRELSPIVGSEPAVPHHSLIAEVGGKVKRHREFLVVNAERTHLPFLLAFVRERE